jgi:hypothetical protein
MQPETADRLLDAWVLEAATRDLPRDGGYWNARYDWIAAERGLMMGSDAGVSAAAAGVWGERRT